MSNYNASFEIETEITNDTVKAYLKTLPIPAKHFMILALKDGMMFAPVSFETISEIFKINSAEAEKLYHEALEMLSLFDRGTSLNSRQ